MPERAKVSFYTERIICYAKRTAPEFKYPNALFFDYNANVADRYDNSMSATFNYFIFNLLFKRFQFMRKVLWERF